MNRNDIQSMVSDLWIKAESIYGSLGNAPTVKFYSKGAAAGKAYIRTKVVAYNETLAAENPDTFSNTVSHEVAHIVQYMLYPSSKAHGVEFKRIHKSLGGSGATYHSYNTLSVKRYRKGSQAFKCGCEGRIHVLTAERSAWALMGCKTTCKVCKMPVQYISSVKKLKGV